MGSMIIVALIAHHTPAVTDNGISWINLGNLSFWGFTHPVVWNQVLPLRRMTVWSNSSSRISWRYQFTKFGLRSVINGCSGTWLLHVFWLSRMEFIARKLFVFLDFFLRIYMIFPISSVVSVSYEIGIATDEWRWCLHLFWHMSHASARQLKWVKVHPRSGHEGPKGE
jgi:hypothetical protein